MHELVALLATITGCVVVLQFARVVAHRLQGRQQDSHVVEELEDLRAQVSSLQGQLNEVLERQDFAERVLAQAKERGALGPGKGTGGS